MKYNQGGNGGDELSYVGSGSGSSGGIFGRSKVLGGGTAINWRWHRNIPKWYIDELMILENERLSDEDKLCFYQAVIWCDNFFCKTSIL